LRNRNKPQAPERVAKIPNPCSQRLEALIPDQNGRKGGQNGEKGRSERGEREVRTGRKGGRNRLKPGLNLT